MRIRKVTHNEVDVHTDGLARMMSIGYPNPPGPGARDEDKCGTRDN